MSAQNAPEANQITVQIGDRDVGRQAYPVRVTLGDGSAASGWLRLGDLPPPPSARAQGDDLAAYGCAVFEQLFAEQLHGLFRQAWIGAQRSPEPLRLQLWIQSDDPELQAIPWELMHLREGAAAPIPLAATPQVAFSRYLDSGTPFGRPIERWPLRILVAIGAPNDFASRWPGLFPVDRTVERERLERVLRAVSASGQIEHRFLEPATPAGLVQAMEDGYQIVIFYGHGFYNPRLGSRLMLEQPDGSTALFAAEDLLAALRRNGSRPALFILISCNTASQHANPALDNLAIQIVRDGSVPAVVAMRDLVAVDLARAFTQYLCDHLLRYGAIDRAVAAARRQVMDRGSAGWSTPVLYMRSRDGRLFVPNAQIEFARLLSNDPKISPRALAAPAGARLALARARPDDGPNPSDARALLDRVLDLAGAPASPAPVVVSGGSRISRSLLLQQWGWQQNRPPELAPAPAQAARPVAIYLPLADDRQLQAGARFEDLLVDAATALDPAHGMALLSLLAGESAAEATRFVLLIDGAEAIAEPLRSRTVELLYGLAERRPEQRLVISCEEADAPAALQRPDTPWIVLQPLSERQMRAYLAYRDQLRQAGQMGAIIRGGLRDLARDPQLLTAIAEQMGAAAGALTRDELLDSLLSRLIDRAAGPTVARTVARDCLYAIAWELHWSHRRSLSLAEAFAILRAAPRDRDYAPDAIYQALVAAGALVEVGGGQVQIYHLALQAYAAARALRRRADMPARLSDIMVMVSFPALLDWWSPLLVALAQRADDLSALGPIWAALRSELSGLQALAAARCLGAFEQASRQSLALQRYQQSVAEDWFHLPSVLDDILIQLDPRFEPSPLCRAQLAEALALLPYPKVRAALRRQIDERVLLSDDHWQYDRPIVRMAAARSLRDLAGGRWDADDASLAGLLREWRAGDAGALYAALEDPQRSTQERVIAAFALGDLSDSPGVPAQLVALLLLSEGDQPKKEWQAVQTAIADALMVEADAALADLLAEALAAGPGLPARTEMLITSLVDTCAGQRLELTGWLREHPLRSRLPLNRALAARALARAIALGPRDTLPSDHDTLRADLQRQAEDLIAEPITGDAPLVATMRRLAIETLVWLGVAHAASPLPAAIDTWPVALRQSWWDLVGYPLGPPAAPPSQEPLLARRA